MTSRLVILTCLALLGACAEPAKPAVSASPAICRPTIADRDVTACYVTLTASTDDRLVRAESPASRVVSLHTMDMSGGVMRMAEMTNGAALPAGTPVAFRPGGDHMMVEGLKQPLRQGDKIVLRLVFEKAPPLEVTATGAQPPLSPGHGGH